MNDRRSLFVSDIHLTESRNDIVAAFFYFLEYIAIEADSLYILGDLFDYWAGDDIETPITAEFSRLANHLTEAGVALYFLHGNRDFALGERYAKRAGLNLIPPYYCLPEEPNIMLLHGDELCLDDHQYQRYKRWIRHPLTLWILRRLPRSYRLNLAHNIRQKSASRPQNSIIDVNESYTESLFKRYEIDTIIHGHTHRPQTHQYSEGERYVLSDWDKRGDYLQLYAGEIRRYEIDITPFRREYE